jgi:hypothetical protein
MICFSYGSLFAQIKYVSPDGNDNNPGTIAQPWASWQHAAEQLYPGDTLYIMPGNYTIMYSTTIGLRIKPGIGIGRNGTSSNPITISGVPGQELPVLDCTSLTASAEHDGFEVENASYWNFTLLEVVNCKARGSGEPSAGWTLFGCANITLNQCVLHDNDNGFITYLGDQIHYINCDSYNNGVGTAQYYGNNGYYSSVTDGATVTYYGCRSFLNGQDGWDCLISYNDYGDGYVYWDRCWSFQNGVSYSSTAGFKTGVSRHDAIDGSPQRVLTNCLSFSQPCGYDESQDPGVAYSIPNRIYNCVSYNNDVGFAYAEEGGLGANHIDIIRNCLSYSDVHITWNATPTGFDGNTVDHNSWNIRAMVSSDFVSLDESQASAARQADGSLPDMTFLHLPIGSDFIDAGIDVGLPYSGSAPDLGAFEFTGINNHPPTMIDQSFEIDENSQNGTVVGTVVASDPDEGQVLEYSIVSGNTDGAFAINVSTGELSVANGAAVTADFALVIQVQDNGTDNLSCEATITINVIPTGIESTGTNSTIKVYPNPVTDDLIIEIKGNKERQGFEILNSTGSIVFKGNLSERTVVPTASLSAGVYIIKLQNGKTFEYKKIVKL